MAHVEGYDTFCPNLNKGLPRGLTDCPQWEKRQDENCLARPENKNHCSVNRKGNADLKQRVMRGFNSFLFIYHSLETDKHTMRWFTP